MEPLDSLIRGDPGRLPEVLPPHRVLLLVLFGSIAKGRRKAESDLDLAVLFQGPPQDESWLREEADLQDELEVLLKPSCPLHLVVLNRASEVLLKEVADHGIVLYADHPERWTLYRISANRRFEDTEKYRRRRWEQLQQKYGVPGHAPGPDK